MCASGRERIWVRFDHARVARVRTPAIVTVCPECTVQNCNVRLSLVVEGDDVRFPASQRDNVGPSQNPDQVASPRDSRVLVPVLLTTQVHIAICGGASVGYGCTAKLQSF